MSGLAVVAVREAVDTHALNAGFVGVMGLGLSIFAAFYGLRTVRRLLGV
jgi:hypothetical protein